MSDFVFSCSGDLVFLSKEFFRATPRDLEDAGCGYEDIVGAHEHSGNYVCSFIYPLGPELISQGYVQFSIGAQLILIVFLQFTCLIFKIILLDQNSDGTVASNALSCLTGAGLEFVLNLHQYMILLPLTAVLPNEFCARVLVPVSTQKAICLFKIAAAMIPYGMPSVLGGIFILYLAYSVGKSASKSNNVFLYLICIVVGTTGLYFFATGLCMVIFWLFGCVVLGMWYALEGVSLSFATAETALILNAMKCTPFLFSFFDVMLYPLPLKDENSFYHASYARLVWARKYAYTLYSSEPCCVDMCAWIWVRLSTLELFISEKIGSCWESILHWCCQRSKGAQVACEDIVFSES